MHQITQGLVSVLALFIMMGHTPARSSGPFRTVLAPRLTNANNPLVEKFKSVLVANAADYYRLWRLHDAGLSEKAFTCALKGYQHLLKKGMLNNKNIISIVDFSKPSFQKRLYVVNLLSGEILFQTLVAHGRNSGTTYAGQFSNLPESHQSSLGFYITLGAYDGNNGYSLRLKGCEKGINDKAFDRAIVLHGAEYVSHATINEKGFLGRSYGCPSVPDELSSEIINLVKNGSCLFIYHPSKKYLARSKLIAG